MEVNFKANYVNSTYIRRYNPLTKKFVPQSVSFVEFNHKDRHDIRTLRKVSKSWTGASYARNIYQYAKTKPDKRTFAITKQEDHFEKLEPDKILSLCQLAREDYKNYCIEFLETKPEYQQENKSREYKRIGSRTLHSLKKRFYDKTIKVNYLFTKIEFYMNNGFDFKDSMFGDLIWKAPKRK